MEAFVGQKWAKAQTMAMLRKHTCYDCAHCCEIKKGVLACWAHVEVPAMGANNIRKLPRELTCGEWEQDG